MSGEDCGLVGDSTNSTMISVGAYAKWWPHDGLMR